MASVDSRPSYHPSSSPKHPPLIRSQPNKPPIQVHHQQPEERKKENERRRSQNQQEKKERGIKNRTVSKPNRVLPPARPALPPYAPQCMPREKLLPREQKERTKKIQVSKDYALFRPSVRLPACLPA
jgi:hypothetical protein